MLIFLLMHRILRRYGARRVLIGSLGLAVVRWLLIGEFPDQLWILVFAQVLHAATFGTFHASSIHLVHHYFTGRVQGRGQALYSSLSYGAGGALGSLLSGYLWSAPGPAATFAVASGMALFGVAAAWIWVDRERTVVRYPRICSMTVVGTPQRIGRRNSSPVFELGQDLGRRGDVDISRDGWETRCRRGSRPADTHERRWPCA